MFCAKAPAEVPEPWFTCIVSIGVERLLEVPYSNHEVVVRPFGLIVPFSIAELADIPIAFRVITEA